MLTTPTLTCAVPAKFTELLPTIFNFVEGVVMASVGW